MPIKLNGVQSNPGATQFIQKFLGEAQNSMNRFMAESFAATSKRIAEAQKSQKKKANNKAKKLGTVSLSNTDSVSRCQRLKAALNAKLGEVYASGADDEIKDALARDIMMQLQRVETKIVEIQRREKAQQEEKSPGRKESEYQKRRRKLDLEKRTTTIKRQYLYSAEEGGLDPNALMPPMPGMGNSPDIGVISGVGGGEIAFGDADVSIDGGSVDVSVGGAADAGVSAGGAAFTLETSV